MITLIDLDLNANSSHDRGKRFTSVGMEMDKWKPCAY
jgi:hypothetical protein